MKWKEPERNECQDKGMCDISGLDSQRTAENKLEMRWQMENYMYILSIDCSVQPILFSSVQS